MRDLRGPKRADVIIALMTQGVIQLMMHVILGSAVNHRESSAEDF